MAISRARAPWHYNFRIGRDQRARLHIADRVVMTAAVVVLDPIFEVDMPAEQHGLPTESERPHSGWHCQPSDQ